MNNFNREAAGEIDYPAFGRLGYRSDDMEFHFDMEFGSGDGDDF
jgi:hypothetical protein